MVKYSVCVIPHKDEPGMRARLESVAGWGEELVVVDFSVPIEGIAYIAAGSELSTIMVCDPCCNQPPVRWKPFGDGVILTLDERSCVSVCVQRVPNRDCLNRTS